MKKIEGYMCEKCGRVLKQEQNALDCEKEHIDVSKLQITEAWFNKQDDNKGNCHIPQTLLVISSGEAKSDVFYTNFKAYYELKKYEYVK